MVGDAMCAACQRIYLQCRTHIDNREHPGAIVKHKGKNKKRSRRVIGVGRCELMLVHRCRNGDVPAVFTIQPLHNLTELFAVRRCIGDVVIRYIKMYHLMQQRLLKLALRAFVVSADAYGEVGVRPAQQLAHTAARHGAQTGASLRQRNTRHRQLIAEIIGVELPEPCVQYICCQRHPTRRSRGKRSGDMHSPCQTRQWRAPPCPVGR